MRRVIIATSPYWECCAHYLSNGLVTKFSRCVPPPVATSIILGVRGLNTAGCGGEILPANREAPKPDAAPAVPKQILSFLLLSPSPALRQCSSD